MTNSGPPPPGTVLLDNASVLNACSLLAGGPVTAVAVHDLATVVQTMMVSERIETLSGNSFRAVMRGDGREEWDLTSPLSLYTSLRGIGLLKFNVLDASWHNDVLERRDEIDRYVSSLDVDRLTASVQLDDVADWRALVFGREMPAMDSNPIYAAPPREAVLPVDLRDRRLEPVDLFVSQTLLYCWYASAADLPLMVSGLRCSIARTVVREKTRASQSAMLAGCGLLASADAEFLRSMAEVFPLTLAPFAVPSPLAFVLSQAAEPDEIFRVAIEAREDGRFRQFRAWVGDLQAALDVGDVRAVRRLAARATRGDEHLTAPPAGEAVVGLLSDPKKTVLERAGVTIDQLLRRFRPTVTLISDARTGALRTGGSLARLESMLGQKMSDEERQLLQKPVPHRSG